MKSLQTFRRSVLQKIHILTSLTFDSGYIGQSHFYMQDCTLQFITLKSLLEYQKIFCALRLLHLEYFSQHGCNIALNSFSYWLVYWVDMMLSDSSCLSSYTSPVSGERWRRTCPSQETESETETLGCFWEPEDSRLRWRPASGGRTEAGSGGTLSSPGRNQ